MFSKEKKYQSVSQKRRKPPLRRFIYIACFCFKEKKEKAPGSCNLTWVSLSLRFSEEEKNKKKRKWSREHYKRLQKGLPRHIFFAFFLKNGRRIVVFKSNVHFSLSSEKYKRDFFCVVCACILHPTSDTKQTQNGRKTENMCSSFRHQKKI